MLRAQHSILFKVFILLLATCLAHSQNSKPQFLKAIWVYVEEISDMDQLEKLCLNNIKHYAKQSSYEVRVFTNQNLSAYLNVSDITNQFKNTVFLPRDTLLRGLIQLTILKEYGGIWIDLPLILTESLQWIDNIENQRHINNRINDAEAILFYTPEWFPSTYKRTSGKIEDLIIEPKYETWFAIMNKENQFIKDWRKLYIQITTMTLNEINTFSVQNGLNPQQFLIKSNDYLSWTARAVIKVKQTKLDRQYGSGSSRRLAVSDYKITGINSKDSAYLLSTEARSHSHLTSKYFAEVSYGSLNQNFSYVLRMPEKVRQEIVALVDFNIPMTEHLHSSVQLVCDGASIPYRHIVYSSVIDKYLLSITPQLKIETYSTEFIDHNCSVTYESVLYEILMGYILPILCVIIHIYVVRKMILIFKPSWGVRRRRIA